MKPIADALELLTAQHDAISVELARIPTVETSSLARLLGELADEIATHLAVEEQFFSMIGIAASVVVHDDLRLALADLLAADTTSPSLPARMAAFTERWTAHARSQEQSIFIALAEILAPEVLEDIGVQIGARAAESRCLAA
jgi:hemerythrin